MKLTFSKQALMPNGSVAESSGGSSSRKRHKEPEVHFNLLCCTRDPLLTNEVLA